MFNEKCICWFKKEKKFDMFGVLINNHHHQTSFHICKVGCLTSEDVIINNIL